MNNNNRDVLLKIAEAIKDTTTIEQAVDNWLTNHPEATTTVQDGSITKAKLDENLQATVDDVSDLKSALDKGVLSYFFDKPSTQTSKVFECTFVSGKKYYAKNLGNTNINIRTCTSDGTEIQLVKNNITPGEEVAFIANQNASYVRVYAAGNVVSKFSIITSGTIIDENVSKLNTLIYDEEYPFDVTELTGDIKTVAKGFTKFVIYGDATADVKLHAVIRNYGTTPVHAVQIKINGDVYNALNVLSSAYTETAYNSFVLNNGFNGYFVIDWSSVTNASQVGNIGADLKKQYVLPLEKADEYFGTEYAIPSVFNVVKDRVVSITFDNVIKCSNINDYQIWTTFNSSAFENLTDRLQINNPTTGTQSETIKLYRNLAQVNEYKFTINTVADSPSAIKALFIGDSMTNHGYFLAELKNMLGNNLTLYGTRSTTVNDADGHSVTVNHEGRAGWSAKDYCSESSKGGITNPFYNNGFDFSHYIESNPSYSDVTDVFILLGTNDSVSTFLQYYQQICSSIRTYGANLRIHCMLPIPPIKSGYAFGTRNYYEVLRFKNNVFDIAKSIIDTYDGETKYYIVPTNANIDRWYDFPRTTVQVNSRNPATMEVGDDNVHPNKYGYYRMADVIYADIIANCGT